MVAKKLALHLDPMYLRRLTWAARRVGQTPDAFLQYAGEESFRHALVEEARRRWERDQLSLPELAAETGLPAEEIAAIIRPALRGSALDMLVAAGQETAAQTGDDGLARLLEEAAATRRASGHESHL